MLSKNHILLYIGILLLGAGYVQGAVPSLNRPTHFLSLSLAGGEGNTLSFGHEKSRLSKDVIDMAGADAQFAIAYEFQYRKFIVNAGVAGSYMLTRQRIGGIVTDDFSGVNKGNTYIYSYAYSQMSDCQKNVYAEVPIQIGYMFTPEIYALIGAKFKMNMFNTHDLQAEMHTVLDMTASDAATVFDGSKGAVGPEGTMGVCPSSNFQSSGTYDASKFNLALTAEVGYMIPVPAKVKRVRMRAGAFFEYGMPVPSYALDKESSMADYSSVGTNYLNNTTSLLSSSVQLPCMLEMGHLSKFAHTMAVGVRFTLLFDVTDYSFPCHCNK